MVNKIGTKLARYYVRKMRKRYPLQGDTFRVGSLYGGWILPTDIKVGKDDAILCAGAGEDISFDTEMARIFKCKVVTVDPTPRAIAHWEELKRKVENREPYYSLSGLVKFRYSIEEEDLERIEFLSVGISKEGGVLKFFYPNNPAFVSCSVMNLQKTTDYFEAECLRYNDIILKAGVSHFKVVKIDIEGAEYGVIEDILESEDKPEIICTDLDELNNVIDFHVIKRLKNLFSRMENAGYYPIWFEGDSVTFKHK